MRHTIDEVAELRVRRQLTDKLLDSVAACLREIHEERVLVLFVKHSLNFLKGFLVDILPGAVGTCHHDIDSTHIQQGG